MFSMQIAIMDRGLILELRIILVSSCIILEISICGGVTEVIKLAYLLFEVAGLSEIKLVH